MHIPGLFQQLAHCPEHSRRFSSLAMSIAMSLFFSTGNIPVATANEASPSNKSVIPQLSSEVIESAKTPERDWAEEYAFLEKEITKLKANHFNLERLEKEAARSSSVYKTTDQTPFDITLRRTKALLEHLQHEYENKPLPPALKQSTENLAAWEQAYTQKKPATPEAALTSYSELCKIRRKLAFSNPLLNFDKITFLTHYTQRQGRGEIHIVDQYLGFNAKAGGAPYILENPFSDQAVARKLLENTPVANGRQKGKKLENGSFLSLELSYDARKLYFAWTQAVHTKVTGKEDWTHNFGNYEGLMLRPPSYHHYYWAPERVYHIYSLDLDSGKLLQLTDGSYNTYDPCELPNGRLVYISEEQGGNQRCGGRWITAGLLHSMKQDGSDAYPLSFHETNEWHPSVNNEGMIVYTRWDYVDRDSDGAHHLWQTYPDGRDPRALHANYTTWRESRPWAELSYRAIPDSRKLVSVAAPHHGVAYGSLVLINPALPDDGGTSQLKRLTPEVRFPEAENAPGVAHKGDAYTAECYGTPWPLSEDFYLCVYAREDKNYGIYLVDSFGNKELIWQDKEVPCLDPIPFIPRKRPTIIPDMTTQSEDKRAKGEAPSDLAETLILNVYDTERPLPEGAKVKWLRVVNIFPKSTIFDNQPNIGMANQSIARGSLGIVPVEEDGSAFFTMPTNTNVYFQLLDEKMQAIHSMRSSTYAHSGERLTCLGCHENRSKTPDNKGMTTVKALKRPPSVLTPEPSGSYPLTFPRLVQPVLDKHCVSCHEQEKKAPRLDKNSYFVSVDKDGKEEKQNVPHGWSNAFNTLHKWGWCRHGGNGSHWTANKFNFTIPGDVGAKASKLIPFLEKGHHDVKLAQEDWHRLSLWIDLNTNFYGAYENTEAQSKGEIVLPRFGMPKVNPLTSAPLSSGKTLSARE